MILQFPAVLYSLPEVNNPVSDTAEPARPNNYNDKGYFNADLSYENVVDVSNFNINQIDDDTDDEPWPESFDPLKPEKPFLPIIKNNRYQNSIIENEATSNLISYKRPQRNQKQFDVYKYPSNNNVASSKSFKPSIKGPKEFFPSIKGRYRSFVLINFFFNLIAV